MPNVMAALPNIGGAPSVQRRKVWFKPSTTVPCNNANKDEKSVEICRGAANYRTDLSR